MYLFYLIERFCVDLRNPDTNRNKTAGFTDQGNFRFLSIK